LRGLKSIGFILASNLFDGFNFHFRIAKTKTAPSPTTLARTMMTINAVLLSPPDLPELPALLASTDAVDEAEAVRVAVVMDTRLVVRVEVVAEVWLDEVEGSVRGAFASIVDDGAGADDTGTGDTDVSATGEAEGSMEDEERGVVEEDEVVELEEEEVVVIGAMVSPYCPLPVAEVVVVPSVVTSVVAD
jgi:hypothetical protein